MDACNARLPRAVCAVLWQAWAEVARAQMDVFAHERGTLATYRVEENRIVKTVDGTNWRVIFTYGDQERLKEVSALLNDAAIGNCTWLRKELQGEPTEVAACDGCPLFDHPGLKCRHPIVNGRAIAYVATRRPDWCPLDQHPLYLRTRPS